MVRALLACAGVLSLGGILIRHELQERERKARWQEIERNAELMRGLHDRPDVTRQQAIELEPAPNGIIMLARAYVVIHAGDHTTREAVPASPIGYGEDLVGCWTTADGTLYLVGRQLRPAADMIAVVWTRTAPGTWSNAVPLALDASLVESVWGTTTCAQGNVTYELVSELTTAPHETVRAHREKYQRDLEAQALRRML
jgi:hypothetical protein